MKKIPNFSKKIELNLIISAALFSSLFWVAYFIMYVDSTVPMRELIIVLCVGVLLISLPYFLVFFMVLIIEKKWISYLFVGLLIFIANFIIALHGERIFAVYVDILKYFGVYDRDLLFIYSEIPYKLLTFQYFYGILSFVIYKFLAFVFGLRILKIANKYNCVIVAGIFVFVTWSWIAFWVVVGTEIPMVFACIFSYPFAALLMLNTRKKYLLHVNM